VALLALPAEIEERVVDADRHADHQDHGAERLLIGRHEMTHNCVQAGRCQHGRERQQDRQAGGDERAEREDQDDERQHHRRQPGPAHIAGEARIELVIRGSLTELLDDQARVRGLHAVDRLQDRRDLLLGIHGLAPDVELDERRVVVAREEPRPGVVERGDDVRRVRLVGQCLSDVPDRGDERGVGDRRRRRLHEHALAGGNLEVRLVEDLLCAPRVSVRDRPRLHLLRADGCAENHAQRGNREPAERRGLPVSGAPTAGAAGEVGSGHGVNPLGFLVPTIHDPGAAGIRVRA